MAPARGARPGPARAPARGRARVRCAAVVPAGRVPRPSQAPCDVTQPIRFPPPGGPPLRRGRSELTPPATDTYNGRGRCGRAQRVARKVILLSACQRPGHQLKGSEGAEEDVPATAHPPQAQAWLPPPDANARRPGGAGGTAAEGALEADGGGREEADPALIRRIMIARALRLRRPFEFERVRKQGRSWATPLVVMAVLPNDLEHNRYGFAVGRRIGKATARNRVKRWMREAV